MSRPDCNTYKHMPGHKHMQTPSRKMQHSYDNVAFNKEHMFIMEFKTPRQCIYEGNAAPVMLLPDLASLDQMKLSLRRVKTQRRFLGCSASTLDVTSETTASYMVRIGKQPCRIVHCRAPGIVNTLPRGSCPAVTTMLPTKSI